ncbi:MAG: hypothetical protein ACRENB_15185, partial [Gemmatimonadales bacterium]
MRLLTAFAVAVVLLILLLAIPVSPPELAAAPAGGAAFAWKRDGFWRALEARFVSARETGCPAGDPTLSRATEGVSTLVDRLRELEPGPAAPELDSLETAYFALGADVAACPPAVERFVALQAAIRETVKDHSRTWDLGSRDARERLYRVLYGSRAAVEEVILHHPGRVPDRLAGRDEPSAAPGAVVAGVTIRSGDLLVSRGGYPTSALIARGSDFPGNFSHVALVHVDSATSAVSAIEAHIERGVSVSSAEEYLRDKKLRILVLRMRRDEPALVRDSLLPHRAASRALE